MYALEFNIRVPPVRINEFRNPDNVSGTFTDVEENPTGKSNFSMEELCYGFSQVHLGSDDLGPLSNAAIIRNSTKDVKAQQIVTFMKNEDKVLPGCWDLAYPGAMVDVEIYIHEDPKRDSTGTPAYTVTVPILSKGDIQKRAGSSSGQDYWKNSCDVYILNDMLAFEIPCNGLLQAISWNLDNPLKDRSLTFTFKTTKDAFYYKPRNLTETLPSSTSEQLNAHITQYLQYFNAYCAVTRTRDSDFAKEYIFGSVGRREQLCYAFKDTQP